VIQNLTEDFLYQRLPEGLVALDERGLIQAVVGGYQDRVEDLRSYSKKLELLFQTSGLPETGNNVVLVDITSGQGKVYTRSLDIQSDTPLDGTAALTTWVLRQIGYTSTDNISNIRYGRDLLRLVDVNTLDYLAATIGAVLYQSSALTDAEQTTANQQILQTYFPRLKFKGTARSFETLGRILGFDDVKVTPLWGRLSSHVPNDIGSPTNDPDFWRSRISAAAGDRRLLRSAQDQRRAVCLLERYDRAGHRQHAASPPRWSTDSTRGSTQRFWPSSMARPRCRPQAPTPWRAAHRTRRHLWKSTTCASRPWPRASGSTAFRSWWPTQRQQTGRSRSWIGCPRSNTGAAISTWPSPLSLTAWKSFTAPAR
jgi:hypothetical protein